MNRDIEDLDSIVEVVPSTDHLVVHNVESIESTDSGSDFQKGTPFELFGGEPEPMYLGRVTDVDKDTFNVFKKSSLGRKASGVMRSFYQQAGNRSEYAPSEQLKRHRSIFGLPMISPKNTWGRLWSIFIIGVDATYTSFIIPVLLAFLGGQRPSQPIAILEFVTGLLFLLDVFINLHVGFVVRYDYKMKIIKDGRSVLWFYAFHGGMWMDVLSATPVVFEIIDVFFKESAGVVSLGAFLRVFRLFRLTKWLKRLYRAVFKGDWSDTLLPQKLPMSVVYTIAVVYTLAMMVNFLGCLLLFTASLEDSEFEGTWIEGHVGTDFENYLTSIYWAVTTVTTVGYGDISPKTAIEQVIIMILMITHIMLFGLLIGSMSEVVKFSGSQAKETYKEKIVDVGHWIQSRKLAPALAKKVHAYYSEVTAQTDAYDEATIVQELPMTLRREIVYSLTENLLRNLDVFSEIGEEALVQLAGRLVPFSVPPGHDHISEGDPVDSMYILEEGTIILLRNGENLGKISGPSTCIESTILVDEIPELSLCPVTLHAQTSCHMWQLKVRDLKPLFTSYPSLKTNLKEGYRSHLMRQFSSHRTRAIDLGDTLEAKLGADMTGSDAKDFKDRLKRTSNSDGSFLSLVRNVIIKNRCLKQPDRTASVSTVNSISEESVVSLVDNIHKKIQTLGVNGMVEFVNKARQVSQKKEEIDFPTFQECMEDMDLVPSSQFALFAHLDSDDSGNITVDDLIALIRIPPNPKTIKVLKGIFCYLDTDKKGAIDIAYLMRNFKVEYHLDVLSGARKKAQVLSTVIQAFADMEDVQEEDFLRLHMDMEMGTNDAKAFACMLHSLWGFSALSIFSDVANIT